MEWSKWVPIIVSFVSGGLAGQVLNLYVNRNVPTVLTYAITTTTAGTDTRVKNLIPNLKLQIGEEEISVVHTHTIDFTAQSGPHLNSAEIAVTFPPGMRIYGTTTEDPSPLHHISCTQITNGFRCTLAPISTKSLNKYRLIIASNQKEEANIITSTDGLSIRKLEEVLSSNKADTRSLVYLIPIMLVLSILTIILSVLTQKFIDWREKQSAAQVLEQIAKSRETH
jgi:hypothetical protein